MDKIIKCKDCEKEFIQKKNASYKRKYCEKCSKKRKKDYNNLYKVKFEECDESY